MRSSMAGMLEGVARVRGVRGAVLTTLGDALPIDVVAHVGVDVDALAAFGASLLRRARQASAATRLGAVRLVSLEARHGRVVAVARSDFLVVALADREASPGLLRVTLQRCLEALA